MKLRLRLRREIGKSEILKLLFERSIKKISARADQAQTDKISLHGESELRNWLFQKNHARDCQEIAELRRICCEETDQARKQELKLSMQQQRNPTTVSQMMAKIRELQNKVNSLSDARELRS